MRPLAFLLILILVALPFDVGAATDVKNDANLSTSLVSYWELEETSGTRVDSHGSNNLTAVNTPGSGTGKQGTALDLENNPTDNSQYVEIADASQTGLDGSANMSIFCWIQFESIHADNSVASKGVFPNRQYLFGHNSSAGLFLFTSSDGSTWTGNYRSWSPSTATWYHVGFTKSGTTGKVYVNGSQQGADITVSNAVHNGGSSFTIGSGVDNTAREFDGLIDECGYWSKTLTGTEITDLYNAGTGIPYDAATPEATTTPATVISGGGVIGGGTVVR